jgi:hypothetical protein
MKSAIYAGELTFEALQSVVDVYRPQAHFAILERIDALAFPVPLNGAIDISRWPKGRLFAPLFELRWERIDGAYRTIFTTEGNGSLFPDGLAPQRINATEPPIENRYYLWDETNHRLGRTLHYECVSGQGNVLLTVREYRDERGRLVFWRYVEMKREEGRKV